MAVLPNGHNVSFEHARKRLDLTMRIFLNAMPLGGASLVRIAQLESHDGNRRTQLGGPEVRCFILESNGYFYDVLILCTSNGALDSDSAHCRPSSS